MDDTERSFLMKKHIYLVIPKEFHEEWHLTFFRIWNNGNKIVVRGSVFKINGFIFNFKHHLLNFRFKSFIFQPFISVIRSGSVFLVVRCNLTGINRLLSFLFKLFSFLLYLLRRSGCTYCQLAKNRTGWMLIKFGLELWRLVSLCRR